MVFHIFLIAFPFFAGWHTGSKSVFLTNTVADPADFMIAAFVGNILMIGDEAGRIENDMVGMDLEAG